MCSRWARPCGSVCSIRLLPRPHQPREVRTLMPVVARSWPGSTHGKRQSWDRNPGLTPEPCPLPPPSQPKIRRWQSCKGSGQTSQAPDFSSYRCRQLGPGSKEELLFCYLSELLGSRRCLVLERSRSERAPTQRVPCTRCPASSSSFQSLSPQRGPQLLDGGSRP